MIKAIFFSINRIWTCNHWFNVSALNQPVDTATDRTAERLLVVACAAEWWLQLLPGIVRFLKKATWCDTISLQKYSPWVLSHCLYNEESLTAPPQRGDCTWGYPSWSRRRPSDDAKHQGYSSRHWLHAEGWALLSERLLEIKRKGGDFCFIYRCMVMNVGVASAADFPNTRVRMSNLGSMGSIRPTPKDMELY